MKICVTEFKEIDIGLELSVVALEGNQRRRCVVKVRILMAGSQGN
jgi:hypothetical protein